MGKCSICFDWKAADGRGDDECFTIRATINKIEDMPTKNNQVKPSSVSHCCQPHYNKQNVASIPLNGFSIGTVQCASIYFVIYRQGSH